MRHLQEFDADYPSLRVIDLRTKEAFGEIFQNSQEPGGVTAFLNTLGIKFGEINQELALLGEAQGKKAKKAKAFFRALGNYIKNNSLDLGVYSVVVITSIIDAQMYIIPGIELAEEQGGSELLAFIYATAGFLPNLILPIAFGDEFYVWLMNIQSPTPGIDKLRSRNQGKTATVVIASSATLFGLFSAFQFAAIQFTEGGVSASNIFLSLMVLLGNAIMNGKAGVGIMTYESIIFRPALQWISLKSKACRLSKKEFLAHQRSLAFSQQEEDFLRLLRKVLDNGINRIEDYLLANPAFETQEYQYGNFARNYPHLSREDFNLLKKYYEKFLDISQGHAVPNKAMDFSKLENYQEFQKVIRLIAHMASDQEFREYPHFIRIFFGGPSTLLGIVSTAGYFSLIFILFTCMMGDALGYSLAGISSIAFLYLTGLVSLDSTEKYIRLVADFSRISILKLANCFPCSRRLPSQIPVYSELLPTALKTYPLQTAIPSLIFLGAAAASFPTSVASTLEYLPLLLLKWFGAPAEFANTTLPLVCNQTITNVEALPYANIAALFFWPTVIGAFLFNGNPMFAVSQRLTLFTMFLISKFSTNVISSHKMATIAFKSYLEGQVANIFETDSENAILNFRDTLNLNSRVQAENEEAETASSAPIETFSHHFGEKRARKSSCSSRWWNYMASFFIGRKIGGEEYSRCVEGEAPHAPDENEHLLAEFH